MKNPKRWFVLTLLITLVVLALPALAQDTSPPLTNPANGILDGLLNTLSGKFGWLAQAIAIVGSFRLVLKPIMTAFHTFAESTATTKDDELLAKVESSAAWKAFTFALDWVTSIKLKK